MTKKRFFAALTAAFAGCLGMAVLSDSFFGGGSRLDSEFHLISEARVNTFTESSQDHACVAALPDGGSVVVWDSRRQQQGSYGVYLQRFDARGRRVGTEQRVNLYQQGMQMNPAQMVLCPTES